MPAEKHLEFIQSAIARMGTNSFQMKSWNVALASAAIGFAAAKDSHPQAAELALVPSFVFWLLDAYYLGLERAFRDLYDGAVAGTVSPYLMKPKPTPKIWLVAFVRPSVLLIHAAMLAIIWAVTGFR
jgi:hypothetical protein